MVFERFVDFDGVFNFGISFEVGEYDVVGEVFWYVG